MDFSKVYSYKFRHDKKERQPGEPEHSGFSFVNHVSDQNMNFIITTVDSDMEDIRIENDNYKLVTIPAVLRSGEIINYNGGLTAVIYTNNLQELRKLNIDPTLLFVSNPDFRLCILRRDRIASKIRSSHYRAWERITGN